LPARLKLAVDQGFDALSVAISDNGLEWSKCDLTESLVAHIFDYVCKSNGLTPEHFAPLT
jgi:hypothetical protein